MGSILNYRDALHKLGVKSVELKSGSDKAPLSPTSEVTQAGKATVMRGLKAVHDEFRAFVLQQRPGVNITKTGEGDVYLGLEAKKLRLCDGVFESEAYVDELLMCGVDVLRMEAKPQKSDRRGFFDVMATTLRMKTKAMIGEAAKLLRE